MKLDEDDDEIRIHSILPLTKIHYQSTYLSVFKTSTVPHTKENKRRDQVWLSLLHLTAPTSLSVFPFAMSAVVLYIYIYKNAQSLYLAQ